MYDQESDIAHCLGPVAARVWRACDGTRDLTALVATTGASEDLVAASLVELGQKNLFLGGPVASSPEV